LARLPLDTLKIDRTFVAGLPACEDSVSICGAIVDLAHRFGMEAVAEGVESDSQMAMLAELGCDHMQGFLFARPVQSADLPRFVLAQRGSAEPGEPAAAASS
jgi:EAL domain-containing protein (putative c-di-GMP-specific phosphodiesterase class I)